MFVWHFGCTHTHTDITHTHKRSPSPRQALSITVLYSSASRSPTKPDSSPLCEARSRRASKKRPAAYTRPSPTRRRDDGINGRAFRGGAAAFGLVTGRDAAGMRPLAALAAVMVVLPDVMVDGRFRLDLRMGGLARRLGLLPTAATTVATVDGNAVVDASGPSLMEPSAACVREAFGVVD